MYNNTQVLKKIKLMKIQYKLNIARRYHNVRFDQAIKNEAIIVSSQNLEHTFQIKYNKTALGTQYIPTPSSGHA